MVLDNTDIADCSIGILADGLSDIELESCEISASEVYGISGDYGSDIWAAYSLVSNDPYTTYSWGVAIGGDMGAIYSHFSDASYGFYIDEDAWADLGDENTEETGFNNIVDNTNYDIYTYEDILAQNNYWGGDEPSDFGGSGSVDYDPWLDEEDGENPYALKAALSQKDAFELFQQGNSLFRTKNYESSALIFEKFIDEFPDSRYISHSLKKWILIQFKTGNNSVIMPYLNALKNSQSEVLLSSIDKLEILVQRKLNNPQDALYGINTFNNESKSEVDEKFFMYQEGLIYALNLHDTKKAESTFQDYIAQYPDDYRVPFISHHLSRIAELGTDKQEKSYAANDYKNVIPVGCMLYNSYPNPFNPSTTIRFDLSEANNVSIKVYDIRGTLVTTLTEQHYEAGTHLVRFDGRSLSSGIYFYKFTAGAYTNIKRMALIK